METEKISPYYRLGRILDMAARVFLIASGMSLIAYFFVTKNPSDIDRAFIASIVGFLLSMISRYFLSRFAPPPEISIGDTVHAPMSLWEVTDVWSHDGREMVTIKPVVEVVFVEKSLVIVHEHDGKEVH